MKAVWFALGMALSCCWPLSAAADLNAPTGEQAQQHVQQLHASLLSTLQVIKAGKADPAAIASAMKPILADPSFPSLTEAERHIAYLIQGATLASSKDNAAASPLLRQASEMPEATGIDWDVRLENALPLHDWKDAAQSATTLAQKWPEKLTDINDQGIFEIVRGLDKSPDLSLVETVMLKAFNAIQWHPNDQFFTADTLWLPLIRLDLEQSDAAGAIALAAGLRDPSFTQSLRVDKRFDPIIKVNPSGFDVMAAYQVSLADKRAKSTAAPDKLEALNAVAETLLTLDRPEEALATATGALTRYNVNPNTFTDGAEQINWTHDVRSRALFALGRSDQALAELAQGAKQQERGQANVSQRINLADQYVVYDRPKDALQAVEGMEAAQASAYGAMALADARACAYFELGDTEGFNKSLAYMQAHVKDARNEYLYVLLFTGRQDAAAAELVAELRDPGLRLEALRWVQGYLPPRHPSAREQARHSIWVAVVNRQDVQKEIAMVGHVDSYPLQAEAF